MKMIVIHEITFTEKKLSSEYSDDMAADCKRIWGGENLDNEHYDGYSGEVIRTLAKDSILGRRNHGSDAGAIERMTVLYTL